MMELFIPELDLLNYLMLTFTPNPATENINFSENVAVKLYSLSGKMVKSSTFCDQMEVADLNNGIYLIRLTGKSGKNIYK